MSDTYCYEVQTRYEDSGLWGVIRTVPVGESPVDKVVRDDFEARRSAVAQAKAAGGQYSDLRIVAVDAIGRDRREHLRVIWENGVWKDDLISPIKNPRGTDVEETCHQTA